MTREEVEKLIAETVNEFWDGWPDRKMCVLEVCRSWLKQDATITELRRALSPFACLAAPERHGYWVSEEYASRANAVYDKTGGQ